MKEKLSVMVLEVTLLFLMVQLSWTDSQSKDSRRKVVFEKIGQFKDGGMAVTVLVKGKMAFVCEFDQGLEILDISDPAQIVKIGQIPDTKQARGIDVRGDIAYISCNVNGLKLYDVSNPSKPRYLARYTDRDGDPHQFLSEGKVGFLTEWHGGFDIIDISNPVKPVRLSQYREPGMMAFSASLASPYAFVTGYKAGLKILNISNPKKPVLVGEFNNGGEANALQVVGSKAYICDKLQGLEIMDISDPAIPRLLGAYREAGSTVGVQLVDNLAFIISWEHGLQAVDISNPDTPVKVGSFFDGGRPNSIQVVGDLIYMADGNDGLEVIRFSKNNEPAVQAKSQNFPVLKGSYLGQKPPGNHRELFAPGIVSTGYNEHGVSFTPDGKEIFYRLLGPPHGVILTMKETAGIWTSPEVASFSGKYDGKCTLSPDGNTLLISCGSPPSGSGPAIDFWTIWIIRRKGAGWGKPENLPHLRGAYPTMSNNGNIYFYAVNGDQGDIFKSEFQDGQYGEAIKVKIPISTEYWENDPYISPDESFLIFQSDRPGTFGQGDLFISYQLDNGCWSEPRNMGPGINTKESGEGCPWVTPDGKYLFFSSMNHNYKRYSEIPLDYKTKLKVLNSPGFGSEDVFWISGAIIDKLRPENHRQE